MPAAKYTPEQRAAALKLYETHGPTEVQKQFGIPKGTVTRWAKETGTETVSVERTRAAVESKQATAKDRIASLRLDIIAIAEHEAREVRRAQRGETTWKTVLKGAGGSEHTEELDFIPPQDKRANANSLASHAGTIKNLAPAEVENNEAAKSMIDKVVDALGVPDE